MHPTGPEVEAGTEAARAVATMLVAGMYDDEVTDGLLADFEDDHGDLAPKALLVGGAAGIAKSIFSAASLLNLDPEEFVQILAESLQFPSPQDDDGDGDAGV